MQLSYTKAEIQVIQISLLEGDILMEQTQNLIIKHQLQGKTITVNTLDGKAITGILLAEESNWLTIEDANGFCFVVQSAIASLFVNKNQKIKNPPLIDPRGFKSLPQTPLNAK
jgi:hypothetical protein